MVAMLNNAIPYRISPIIPVYNGERYLADAIRSVLSQTHPVSEIIVVDDGSTDTSASIAHRFGPPVRVLTQPNLGPAAARNLGVAHATGDLLAFLDADDLWMPDKLVRQTAVLLNDLSCEAVLGKAENFISPELDETEQRTLARSASQTGVFLAGVLLIRRDAFLRVGQFNTCLRQGEFIEWWARATKLDLHYAVLPELVLRRRLHGDNLTRREAAQCRSDYLRLLREQLAHRRATITQPHSATLNTP